MSKVLVVILMGAALFVVCMKFFCCRRNLISDEEAIDSSHDADDTDKAELTRISSTTDTRQQQPLGEYSPVRGQESLEVTKDIDEDDNQQ